MLVIDHMVLGSDVVGAQVAHEANGGGVLARKTKELAQPWPRWAP